MLFALITFITAFSIEALGTFVSVIGLSTLFGSNPVIMAVAIALDVGKLVVVSLLYTYWKQLGGLMKSYALIASVITMTITSAGAFGYLSGEFQKAIIGTQEGTLKVDVLKTEQAKLEARKTQIDDQIAKLPANFSSGRLKLMKGFEAEQKQITDRLTAIGTELPTLQVAQISVEAKAGPILYISKAFNISVEDAAKYVILLIIVVFDPLAVFLIIAGNFLVHQRRVHKEATMASADLFEDESLQRRINAAEEVFIQPKLVVPEIPAEPEQIAKTFKAAAPEPDGAPVIDDASPVDMIMKPMTKPALPDAAKKRDTITLSSLGAVRADPNTITDTQLNDDEVGSGTGAFKTRRQPK